MADTAEIQNTLAVLLANMKSISEEASKQNKVLHDENKKIYASVQDQSKQMLESTEKWISEKVEIIRSNIESVLEVNNLCISECEAKISGIEEKVVWHASTMSELVAEQDLRIQELQHQMSWLQSTSSPLNQTTYCLLYTSRCV